MDIIEVRHTIMKWIISCDRIEQIDQLQKSIPPIIDTLFEGKESKIVIDASKVSLLDEMIIQRELLKQTV